MVSLIKLGTSDIAKYPFLDEAGEYARKLDIDIWNDRDIMEPVIQRAEKRILTAVRGDIDKELGDYRVELLTLVSCLVLVKMLKNDKLARKYALMEARRIEAFLIEEAKKDKTTMPLVLQVLQNQFKVKIDNATLPDNTALYSMRVTDFLPRAVKMHTDSWKLINQAVHRGIVYLEHYKVIRLLRQEVQELILQRLSQLNLKEDLQLFTPAFNRLYAEVIPKFQSRIMIVSEYPPCVRSIIDMLNRGENVSHPGRIFIASYMAAVGKGEDDIVDLFKNAPDFKEQITRYQVRHLLKAREQPGGFGVTGCEKLKFNSLCFPDAKCEGIRNPMKYGQNQLS